MSYRDPMKQASKENPCPVCGKPDWCLVAEDRSAAICPRTETGAVKRCGDAGWLHVFKRPGTYKRRFRYFRGKQFTISETSAHQAEFTRLATSYQKQITTRMLQLLADTLGVSIDSLCRLGVGWDGKAYTFPMSDPHTNIIGIRRRFNTGRKCCVKGSKNGLFIPDRLMGTGYLLVVEGNTDAAAALDLGFDVVGRSNCNSLIQWTCQVCQGRHVVIIADNDLKPDGSNPGRDGAYRLARSMAAYSLSTKVLLPPTGLNDLRQWAANGLTSDELIGFIENAIGVEVML